MSHYCLVRRAHATLLMLTACSSAATPRLPLTAPSALLRSEGQTVSVANPAASAVNFMAFLRVHEPLTFEEATFPLDAETLAALLIQAAQEKGWRIDSPRRALGGRWSVVLIHPSRWDGARHKEYLARITPAETGATIAVGEGNHYLPPELLPPLRAAVDHFISSSSPRVQVFQ